MGVLVCKMAGLAYYYPALLAVLIHQAAANNQTGEDFTVKINQDGVAKRSFCCLFAKDHCSEPCQDKKCSAKCTPGPSSISSTTSTPGPPGPKTCSEGWLEVGLKCYRHFADLSNFIVANNKCITRGGTLAVISSQEEQEQVASLHPHTGAWIGAQDWLDEGKFSWVDGTWIDPTRSATG